ncbi:acyltransferase family protein [bacterium]|nr:acyltransferase family protein [bacterium]
MPAPIIFPGRVDHDSLENFDLDFVRRLMPIVRPGKWYFRSRVYGVEKIPEGRAIIVGNHNSGITFFDPFLIVEHWYGRPGNVEPIWFMAHEAVLKLPVLGALLPRLGAIRASPENAHKILARGGKFGVYPGGDYDAFKPYRDRHRIDFAGRKGFARIAVETKTPIVPLAHVGGHETFFVLTRGETLAKILRLDKTLRSKVFPISIAAPWGLMIGPMFHLPLPARVVARFGDPIDTAKIIRGARSFDAKVDRVYNAVTETLQGMIDEIVADRKR